MTPYREPGEVPLAPEEEPASVFLELLNASVGNVVEVPFHRLAELFADPAWGSLHHPAGGEHERGRIIGIAAEKTWVVVAG